MNFDQTVFDVGALVEIHLTRLERLTLNDAAKSSIVEIRQRWKLLSGEYVPVINKWLEFLVINYFFHSNNVEVALDQARIRDVLLSQVEAIWQQLLLLYAQVGAWSAGRRAPTLFLDEPPFMVQSDVEGLFRQGVESVGRSYPGLAT